MVKAPPGARPQVQVPPAAVPAPIPSPAPVQAAPLPPTAAPVKDEMRAALLVPLSGPYAAWGQALSNAAQLALFEAGDDRLNLIPLDTKGNAEGAAAAARQAVAQGADIVLGPLFSAEVRAAGPVVREQAVPMLAFTTDRAAAGQGIYTLGFLPHSQVNRVVGHARALGKERFALLAPSNDYGRAVGAAFEEAVAAQGGRVVKAEYYDPQVADLTNVVRRFTESDRRKAKDGAVAAPPPFDALLLPEEGTRLRSIASLVTYFEVDPGQVALLGTMLWDDARLGNEPALQGGWYAAPGAQAYADFERRYAAAFGARPPKQGVLRASLAYDATALAAALTRQNLDFIPETLTHSSGFAGIDGLFRLLPDGGSQRGLAVFEVAKGAAKEVGPAPSSFVGLGQ